MSKPIGVILAGGRGRRMGADKALVAFRGTPMIDRVAGALTEAGLEVLVVGRSTEDYQSIDDVADLGGGPAVGLVTALRHTAGDVFVVAVDQPLLRSETVLEMIDIPGDAVVPIAEGHPQVTCAVYRASCLPAFEHAIEGGQRKLRRLLDTIETTHVEQSVWETWGEDGRSWLSLDTREAVRRAEALR